MTEQQTPLAAMLHVNEAESGEPVPDGRVSRVRRLVLDDVGLHYLAGYGVGVRHFDVDALQALEPGGAPAQAAAQRRALCRKIGRKISFQVARHLNDWLTKLETGPLVRTVIRTAAGAVYCDQVVPGQYLVGATVLAHQGADFVSADEALALCVADIRSEILLNTQDLGGWESERLRHELQVADETTRENLAAAMNGAASDVQPQTQGQLDHPGLALCRAELHPSSLQLAALFDNGEQIFSVDLLSHGDVCAPLTSTLRASARRELYQHVGAELPAYVREIARTARDVIGGPMSSAVLDVEQGALYFRRLGPAQYLFGVTLNQTAVSVAEDALAQVATRWPTR